MKISPAGAGVGSAVLTTEVDLEEGGDVTAAAIGEVSSDDTDFELLVLEDDNGVLDTDTARIRVVHASPDAPDVDVTVNDGALTLFDGVTFGESGDYVEVPAAPDGTPYEVEVRPDTEDNDGTVVLEQDLTVAGGEVYTVFAEGYLSADDEPIDNPMEGAFRLVVANDASPAPATVTFTDQTVDGDDDEVEVEVAQASLSEGGFVVIHNETLLEGEVAGSIIGNSDYLEPGTSTEIEIEADGDGIVDANGDGTTTLIAMAYRDTDGDEEYGFPGEDGPYIDPDDTNGDGTDVVIDPAAITVEEDEEEEEDDEDDEDREDEDDDERGDDDGGRDEDEEDEEEEEDDEDDDRGRGGDRGRGRGGSGRGRDGD